MTSQRHFSFSFPEEMDGLIDFQKFKKSDIESLVNTPIIIF